MRILCHRRAAELLYLLLVPITIMGLAVGGAKAQELKERSEISDKYKWDLTTIYKTDQDWEADMAAIEAVIPNLASYEGKISKSPKDLLAYFKDGEELSKKFGNVAVYARIQGSHKYYRIQVRRSHLMVYAGAGIDSGFHI
jgi:hypothetical protein